MEDKLDLLEKQQRGGSWLGKLQQSQDWQQWGKMTNPLLPMVEELLPSVEHLPQLVEYLLP